MHMPKYTPTRLGTGCLPEEGKSVPPSFVPCRADTSLRLIQRGREYASPRV